MNNCVGLVETFRKELADQLANVNVLWNETGLDEQTRQQRLNAIFESLHLSLQESVKTEETEANECRSKVAETSSSCLQLSKDLGLNYEDVTGVALIKKLALLSAKLDTLTTERNKRQTEMASLQNEIERLSYQLQIVSSTLPPSTIPSIAQLDELRDQIRLMQKDLDSRKEKFAKTVAQLKSLINRCGYAPNDFEEELIAETADEFLYSNDNMELLDSILNKVNDKYNEYLGSLKQSILDSRKNLIQMWDKCKVKVADCDGDQLPDECYNEELLDRYKAQVAKMEEYFDKNREILEKVNEWDAYFQKKLELEEKQKDPNRFHQLKGGALELELKELNRANKRVAQLETEILELAPAWSSLKVYGTTVDQYVLTQKNEYEEAKQREKLEKQKAKMKSQNNVKSGRQSPTVKGRPI